MRATVAAVLLAAAVLPADVPAATHVPPVVDQRQEQMRTVARSAKLIAEMFEGKRPYDGAGMLEAAETIRRLAGSELAAVFPDGSFEPPSSALPAIEGNREGFTAIAGDLARLAGDLAAAVRRSPHALTDDMRMGADMLAMNPLFSARRRKAGPAGGPVPAEHVFHMMLQTCTSCHAKFRRPKE